MKNMRKIWNRYLVFAGIFEVCSNLLYLSVPVYLMVIHDRVMYSYSMASLVTLSCGLLFTLAVMGVLVFLRSQLLTRASDALAQKLLPPLLSSLQADAAGVRPTGYRRGIQDLACLKEAMARGTIFAWIDAPWMILYFILLFIMHPLLAVVAFIGFSLAGVFYLLIKNFSRDRFVSAEAVAEANREFVSEILDQPELVSGMGLQSDVIEKFNSRQEKASGPAMEAESFRSGIAAVVLFISTAAVAGTYGAGAWLFFEDEITPGIMLAAVLVAARIFFPLEKKLAGLKQGLEARAAYDRLQAYVDTSGEKSTLALPRPKGKLSVENALLVIQGRRLLQNVSFSLEAGESLGIFGPAGAGKSLLCNLILGIWPPTAGKVRLDGADTAQWDRAELGRYIGYLPQKAGLFSGRVDENIARLQTVDSEKVIKACKKAFVHEMVLKLPAGYDTMTGRAGSQLSAGQTRRIACARALYGDPSLVVMDRPNSDLDEEGMRALFTTIAGLQKEKTTLVMVTENPNLLRTTDKLLFLKNGQVAVFGPTQEVLAKLANKQPAPQE